MREIKHSLLTNNYTRIYCEEPDEMKFNAPHRFRVLSVNKPAEVVCEVKFQEGPIKEHGINGAANEDLIIMVVERLESFQQTEYKCRENAIAITRLEEALLWLRKRTMGREQRGVEGTKVV